MDTCRTLAKIISYLLKHPELTFADTDKLNDLFLEYLSKTMQLAYDANINVDKLKAFTEKYKNPNAMDLAIFLGQTLENEKTYTLLNNFLNQFIQAYLPTVKPEYVNSVNQTLRERVY